MNSSVHVLNQRVPVPEVVVPQNPVLSKNNAYLWTVAIASAHLVFWILPALFWRSALPLDVTEGFAYSLQWQWGYERDPYLLTLMVELGRFLTHNHTWILYVFSQLAVLASFLAVWRLARAVGLSTLYALISVLCLEGIAYYNYSTPEFNDNVLILPFWAWSGYFFYRACQTERAREWLLLGATAGLATMAKHSAGLLVLSMLFYLTFTQDGRRHWSKPGVYLGSLLAFVIVLPNILWLFNHDFVTLFYAGDRASVASQMSLWNHLINPLKFIVSQGLVILPALILLAIAGGVRRSPTPFLNREQWSRLLTITVLPFLLVVLCSVISGGELPSHWGTPLYLFIGITVLAAWRPIVEKHHWQRFTKGVAIIFSIMLLGDIAGLLWLPRFQHDLRANFPGKKIAGEATALWNRKFPHSPLRYVEGDRWVSGNISVFAHGHPVALPYFFWDTPKPGTNLIVSPQALKKRGAMVVWPGTDSRVLRRYPHAILLGHIPFKYVHADQRKPEYITVAAVPPEAIEAH